MTDSEKLNTIEKNGGVEIENGAGNFYCLSIIGQIEGHYALEQGQKTTKRAVHYYAVTYYGWGFHTIRTSANCRRCH